MPGCKHFCYGDVGRCTFRVQDSSTVHLCAVAGVVVTSYRDEATGWMAETADGSGHFTRALLWPRVEVRDAEQVELARRLHREAHAKCFIANSVNFAIDCEADVTVEASGSD
jgi:organic hydroperoxide reductase OsmC/OhrA